MINRFIGRLQGYAALSERDIAVLGQAMAHSQAVDAKRDLIREGDQPGPVFVLLEGWALRYKVLPSGSRQIMALLMPGDACDLHGGLLTEMDHGIRTLTRASVATISRSVMDELLGTHPAVARALYVAQLVNEAALHAWIISLGRRSSIERVAHLLMELLLRAVRAGICDGATLELPLSQVVLADALGMTPVHINRVLQDLRRSGAVELRRGVLRIQDPAILAQVSGFDANHLHKRLK